MPHLNQFIQQCHTNLISGVGPEIDIAKDYLLRERGIKPETINTHELGYCYSKQDIPNNIAFHGKNLETLADKDRGYSYFIQGKIVVPVFSELGKAVGFATRKPSSEPGNTWWNLSAPFCKSEHLFLLDKARKDIFKNNKIYLVEGYMDALILYQEGLTNVVALMGTNLSPRQVGLIARYCSNICLSLDVDENESGQKASGKSIYHLKKFDFYEEISTVDKLPVKKDPDTFVLENGLQEFLKLERVLSSTEITKIYKDTMKLLKQKS